jgi:hypothetical protein
MGHLPSFCHYGTMSSKGTLTALCVVSQREDLLTCSEPEFGLCHSHCYYLCHANTHLFIAQGKPGKDGEKGEKGSPVSIPLQFLKAQELFAPVQKADNSVILGFSWRFGVPRTPRPSGPSGTWWCWVVFFFSLF